MLAWASENLLYTGSEVPQSHFPAATAPKMLHGAAWDQSRGISACPGALLFSHSATCCQNINRQKKKSWLRAWTQKQRWKSPCQLFRPLGHLISFNNPPVSSTMSPFVISLPITGFSLCCCYCCFLMFSLLSYAFFYSRRHLTFKNKSCFLLWTLTLHILGNRRLMSWNFFLKNQILI